MIEGGGRKWINEGRRGERISELGRTEGINAREREEE